MAENKTKENKASVTAFLEAIPDQTRRADAKVLLKLMKAATGEKPAMWGPSIIGFGTRHYKYDTGREGDMPLVGFSPRKAATVIYGTHGCPQADTVLAKLGKHTHGKGCLYIKKLADVHQGVLEELIAKSVAAARAKHSSQ
jgi:hypothetical protein